MQLKRYDSEKESCIRLILLQSVFQLNADGGILVRGLPHLVMSDLITAHYVFVSGRAMMVNCRTGRIPALS